MLKQHENTFAIIQKLLDACAILLSWAIAYYWRFEVLKGGQPGLLPLFLKISPMLLTVTIYSFYKHNLYHSMRFTSRYTEIFSVLRANGLAVIGFVILLYFFGDERLSRLAIVLYWAIATMLLISVRMGVRNFLRALRRRGRNLRHVLLIGNGKPLEDYVKTVKCYKDSGIKFLGWIDDGGLASANQIEQINETYDSFKQKKRPDSIILSYANRDGHKAGEFIATHYNDVIPIQLLPDLSYSLVGHQIEDFGGVPVLTVNQPTFNFIELMFKRNIDFFGSLIGLLLISPILFIISLLVKLSSPGPVFYGQERIGLEGQDFTMWKFRTMRLASENEDKTEWSNKENPRKTAIGDFLRKTSLDELPQLWNVLIGQMSLVGPRPERPFFVEKFRQEIPGYMLRHKMKAGITGWAQVNGWRGDTDLNKRIECDIYYIKNWSIWFDIKILFLTFIKGFINKNAY